MWNNYEKHTQNSLHGFYYISSKTLSNNLKMMCKRYKPQCLPHTSFALCWLNRNSSCFINLLMYAFLNRKFIAKPNVALVRIYWYIYDKWTSNTFCRSWKYIILWSGFDTRMSFLNKPSSDLWQPPFFSASKLQQIPKFLPQKYLWNSGIFQILFSFQGGVVKLSWSPFNLAGLALIIVL